MQAATDRSIDWLQHALDRGCSCAPIHNTQLNLCKAAAGATDSRDEGTLTGKGAALLALWQSHTVACLLAANPVPKSLLRGSTCTRACSPCVSAQYAHLSCAMHSRSNAIDVFRQETRPSQMLVWPSRTAYRHGLTFRTLHKGLALSLLRDG